MKKNKSSIALMRKMIALLLFSIVVLQHAMAQQDSAGKTIKITGTRLTYPIIQKWIDEYSKLHPQIKILVSSSIPAKDADILIVSHILGQNDVKDGQSSIALTRYLQLPIANSQRGDADALQATGFTEADFQKIYFLGGGDDSMLPPEYQYTVYKREKSACASIAFANHFGNQQKDIQGTGVTGDDRELLEAVKKDTRGISYNNLGFIYNIKTRKIVDSIVIIPIDFNENGKIDPEEKIYNTLDDVLKYAEHTKNQKLLTENVHAIFRKDSRKDINEFLQWIISKGQQYNHEYGFLNLDKNIVESEQRTLVSLSLGNACVPSTKHLISNTVTKK